ncbi:MAG: hypothetical protein ACRDJY_04280 [Thermoleophilaceae bacterium]
MKLKIMLAMAGVALFALSGSMATAGTGDKVTGGGQTIIGNSGKGSTIAFTAQQDAGAGNSSAKGQVQFIDRSAGTGRNQVKYHGIVDCVEVDGEFGVIGGFKRGDEGDRFSLRVVDNGEPNNGMDLIQFGEEEDNSTCGDGNDDEPPSMEFTLSRGNAQVRDGDTTSPAPQQSSSSSALSVLGF